MTDAVPMTADELVARARSRDASPAVVGQSDFTGAALRGLDLAGWTFVDCVFDEAVLTGADLSRTVWRGGSARRAKLVDVDLVDAQLHSVDLSGAALSGALLTDAVFDGCRAMGASFERSRGLGVTFRSCNLYAANLDGCSFGGRPVTGNRMDEVSLRKADLRGCLLEGTSLVNADLTKAKLDGADLRGATLGDVDGERLMWLAGAIVGPAQAAAILAQVADILVS